MEEFNEIAVRRIIVDMNTKLGACIDVTEYNHDQRTRLRAVALNTAH